jgi:DNA-directed RNA polymerase specialized sigma24 family protein
MKSARRWAAELHRLNALTSALPTDTRRVFTLHKVYDLAIPEIATRLHLSERAVEQHLVTAALAFAGCASAHNSDFSESAADYASGGDRT